MQLWGVCRLKKWSSKQSCGVWNCTRTSSLWHYFQRPYLGQKLERFSKYCSPFKNHQEQLNDLSAFNSLVPNPVLRLSDTGIESVRALYANPPHSFPAPSLGISLWSQENRYKPHPPPGEALQGLCSAGLRHRGPSELISSPTKDTDVLLMLNGNSWGWMRNSQMRDTKMSDSLPTVVAMRSNSQHQSDKLSDRMVQPWHGTTLATRQDTRAGSNTPGSSPA